MSNFKHQVFRPRNRVKIEKAIRTANGKGGFTTTWRELETVWAEFLTVGSAEQYNDQQEQNRITQKIRIRHREMNSTEHRINFKDRIMNIDSLYDPDESRRFLHLRLVEVKA